MEITIRPAHENDVKHIFRLIQELATYEKAPEQVSNTESRMLADGFGANSIFKSFVAEADGKIIGTAIFYFAYSTWKGRYLFLDDLIVTESCRKSGAGKKLFDQVILFALENNCNQMRWQVLDWNEPAIQFYKKYNATLDPEWLDGKLSVAELKSIAEKIKQQ